MKPKEKIRVLHTHQIIRSGGVEQRKLILHNKLPKELFDQKIICTQALGEKSQEYRNQGFDIIEVGIMKHPFDWNIHKRVGEVIKNYRPHIIHGTVYEGMSMAAINGFRHRVPKTILEETSYPTNRSWRATKLLNLYSKVSDAIIGVSPAVVHYLEQTAKIPREKVHLIMNGANIPLYDESAESSQNLRSQLNIPKDGIIIGSVGRMDNDIKGFRDLIYALKKLVDMGLPIYLVIVGDGKKLDSYNKLANDINIDKNIIFTGYKINVNPYYSIFDIFVLASYSESFGLVVTEAWFHKLPVIASNVGGLPFLISDLRNGILFESGNINELVSKILMVLNDKNLSEKLGLNGNLEACNKYTAEIYAESITNLYLKLFNIKT